MNDAAHTDREKTLAIARNHIIVNLHAEARGLLQDFLQEYPDSVEAKALLLRSLGSEEFPSPQHRDDIYDIILSVPGDMESVLDFSRRLMAEESAAMVEGVLEERWRELLDDGADEEMLLQSTTLLAESFLASERYSSAIDVVREARAVNPLPAFDLLRDRLLSAVDGKIESPMAELHALRRQMQLRYFEEQGIEFFEAADETKLFFNAFIPALNRFRESYPMRYAAIPDDKRDTYLGSLYEELYAEMDRIEMGGDPVEPTPAELEKILAYMRKSEQVLDHPMFDDADFIRPAAGLLPAVMVHLSIETAVIDAFLAGDSSEGVIENMQDSVYTLVAVVGMRLATDEQEYQENFTELYNLVHLHLPFNACLPTISDMCREIDEFIASMGTRPLQFIPAKAGAATPAKKNPGRPSASRKFGKKKKKK